MTYQENEVKAGTSIPSGRAALVTGGAGFIGSHLVDRLLREGWQVTVLDNFDPYYDPAVKRANLASHRGHPGFRLIEADVRDREAWWEVPGSYDVIVHLAARPGVRASLEDPEGYEAVNVGGTRAVLDWAVERGIRQFVHASSSSVYGVNPNVPWREDDPLLLPASPYARTKVQAEELGRAYAEQYGLRFIALRFFSVYGPRQRPDLAFTKFARRMLAGEPIPVYGDGSSRRDYTYVGDIIEGVRAAMDFTDASFMAFNLGNCHTHSLREMIEALEAELGVEARWQRLPEQPGDVPQTWADITRAERLLGYHPCTSLRDGLRELHAWLRTRPLPLPLRKPCAA
ncbi:epimerase [Rhodothermaceae bacterium RA]|nr:epimerase [Rhodothermaceae bacterium RA]